MKERLRALSTFKSKSEKETIDFASDFARILKKGDLLLLSGEIGSGKTTFLNGVLKNLGSKRRVISSSFVLVSFYQAKRCNLVHCDLYRIGGRIGFDEIVEYLTGDNIVAIEWPYKVERFFIFKPYLINLTILDLATRMIEVFKYG